jgi:cell division protein FtsW (lipid II flippase)
MRSELRLALCGAMIVLSALYAVLVNKNPDLATAVAAGYVALLLTIFVSVNVWKKP